MLVARLFLKREHASWRTISLAFQLALRTPRTRQKTTVSARDTSRWLKDGMRARSLPAGDSRKAVPRCLPPKIQRAHKRKLELWAM
eukprot:3555218-Amphidinium_carterae.1